jgi:hypothetical protein
MTPPIPRRVAIAASIFVLLGVIAYFAYQRWNEIGSSDRDTVLAGMPTDATAVLYADVAELRPSPFVSDLYAWVPQREPDADYSQFVRETGFDYERDLNRVAVALTRQGPDTEFLAIADGRFDQTKIVATTLKFGSRENRGSRHIFFVPATSTARRISFTFLRRERIALSDDSDLDALLSKSPAGEDARAWRERFKRLAGSPLFAVIRQDGASAESITSRAPGGFQSPQLSALLDQLQWITIAGRPEGNGLRVVMEGESTSDSTVRQLADLLNGVLMMAQAGLNGSRTRRQLDPLARDAYLEMLRGADVSHIDRGETKSVRVVFNVTPRFLAAVRSARPILPAPPAPPETESPSPKARAQKSHK